MILGMVYYWVHQGLHCNICQIHPNSTPLADAFFAETLTLCFFFGLEIEGIYRPFKQQCDSCERGTTSMGGTAHPPGGTGS